MQIFDISPYGTEGKQWSETHVSTNTKDSKVTDFNIRVKLVAAVSVSCAGDSSAENAAWPQ